jgi:hypothetical protein
MFKLFLILFSVSLLTTTGQAAHQFNKIECSAGAVANDGLENQRLTSTLVFNEISGAPSMYVAKDSLSFPGYSIDLTLTPIVTSDSLPTGNYEFYAILLTTKREIVSAQRGPLNVNSSIILNTNAEAKAIVDAGFLNTPTAHWLAKRQAEEMGLIGNNTLTRFWIQCRVL